MANVTAGQIEAPHHRKSGFMFQVLRENLAQDRLFGEVLGPDHDTAMLRRTSAQQDGCECSHEDQPAHQRFLCNRFCSKPKAKSAVSASAAAGIAPARMSWLSTMAPPQKTNPPSPPAPPAAAIVATQMAITAATRIPAMMVPMASGSSTWKSNWRSVMPMPLPTSRTAGSTPVMPA